MKYLELRLLLRQFRSKNYEKYFDSDEMWNKAESTIQKR